MAAGTLLLCLRGCRARTQPAPRAAPRELDKASGPFQAIPAPPQLLLLPGEDCRARPGPRPSPGAVRRCPGGGGGGGGEVSAVLRPRVSAPGGARSRSSAGHGAFHGAPQAVALRSPRPPRPSGKGGHTRVGAAAGRPAGTMGATRPAETAPAAARSAARSRRSHGRQRGPW